ncbi:hypothetical protein CRM22_005347 [Opisthorchis felineus]|uniref:Uncharacterized protein n=1 Tax=Opisthorchis felineus TaxID=147828 RepID=A0A4S2LYC0_OPIFE|nr:hypothetical protein CRM22_005347 [Opisthorchis felineus]
MTNRGLTGQTSSFPRGPEAGDSLTISAISTCHASHTKLFPSNLLNGYPMQWALNRTLLVINTHQTIQVNAYKLAKKSEAFRELTQLSGTESNKRGATEHCTNSSYLTVFCEPQRTLELYFAVHLCHIGNCQLGGITRLDREYISCDDSTNRIESFHEHTEWDPGAPQYETIIQTKELVLTKCGSYCTLQYGLRTAALYGLMDLKQRCHEYARQIINQRNCWLLWQVATSSEYEDGGMLTTIDKEFTTLVEEYILTSFGELTKYIGGWTTTTDEESIPFEALSAQEMAHLLSSHRLNVRHESDVVHAIQCWVEAPGQVDQISSGEVSVSKLIASCVRADKLKLRDVEILHNLSTLEKRVSTKAVSRSKSASKVYSGTVIKRRSRKFTNNYSNFECWAQLRKVRRRLVRSARNLRPLEDIEESVTNNATEELRKRLSDAEYCVESEEVEPRLPHEAIFTFGGWKAGGPCQDVYVYDARKDSWITCESGVSDRILLPHALMSFGIVVVQNRYIYIAGGEQSDKRTTSAVVCYDFEAERSQLMLHRSDIHTCGSGWKPCPSLHESRRDLVLVNWSEERIYALGGDNNRSVLSTVEYFDLNETSRREHRGWSVAPNMLMARGAPAADCLKRIIYVCGGYTESRMEALTNSCEAFCPDTNQWTFIQPMAQARYYAQAVAVNGVLFVLGGGGESGVRGAIRIAASAGYSSTVERYNPQTEMWELMPPATERADFAACHFEGELVCLGGGGETFCMAEVERWKPWIPRAGPRLNHNTTANDPTLSQGPIWLGYTYHAAENGASGWTKSGSLPYPVWGHRCVVIKGWDLILPYLKRKCGVREEETNTIQWRNVAAKCKIIHDWPILVPQQFSEDDSTALNSTELNHKLQELFHPQGVSLHPEFDSNQEDEITLEEEHAEQPGNIYIQQQNEANGCSRSGV